MRRVCILVFVISLFTTNLEAQNHFYTTQNYAVQNGLPQSQVTAMVEDKNGYLWLGTQGGGLARFDGRDFKVYTTLDGLLTTEVTGLKIDARENLWILHPKGVTKFDGLHFKKFQFAERTSLSGTETWRMFEVRDTMFVLSAGSKISKIYNDSIYYWEKPAPVKHEIKRMHVSPKGEACFYLADGSFIIRQQNDTIAITSEIKFGQVFNFFNYKGDVLFRTKDAVYKLDIVNKNVSKMPWSTDNFVVFYDEREDVFWTGHADGLLKEKITADGKSDLIISDIEATQVLVDSEGNTWIATNGSGLYKYFIQDFQRFDSDDIRGVMAVEKDKDGAVWVGTMYKGLWKIQNGKTTPYVDGKNSYRNTITSVKKSPTGEVWVGSGFGLGLYNKKTDSFRWFLREDGLPGTFVGSLDFDDKGLWFGTSNGLSYYDGKSFKNYTTKDGLSTNNIWTLHYSRKFETLFIGTKVGFHTLKNGKIELMPLPELVNTSVLTIRPYKDSLLVMGTAGAGVVLLNPKTNRRKLITTREGLASDFIYFAAVDERNYLWIGSEKGINRIMLDNKLDIIENIHFNYDNGLAGVETNQNAFYISAKEKYFGLVDGLYEFNQRVDQQSNSFDVHLTDVQILYGEYSPRQYADSTYSFFRIPYQPLLPPDKNHVTFYFNRVDKRYSKSVKYKYFLENFDKTWSQPSSVNSVTYSNLPPGEYVFRVMGTDTDGSWGHSKIAYLFTIKTPFYKTTAFIVCMFILAGGLITLVLYVRVKQRINRAMMMERIRQKEQETLRKEIARDFHDEMGNQLTRIINYVSLLKLNGNGHSAESNGADLYTKVEDSAKYLYNGTRDFIWSIDPVNDELSKLFIYIRDFGEKLFEEKNINFRAFNELKEKIKLPYGFCREANLIFKEAMTNAFKYSEAKNVSLTLKRDEDDGYIMSLEDDGIGFYTDDVQKSNGLQNIRERADRINAELRIHSEKDLGTKIILNFKITKTLKYGLAF
jgi:signal transduction histidine kinase